MRSVVITPRERMQRTDALQTALAKRLGEPLRLRLDLVVLEPGAGAIEAQREEICQASDAASLETTRIASLSQVLALTAGVAPIVLRSTARIIAPWRRQSRCRVLPWRSTGPLSGGRPTRPMDGMCC